MNNKDISQKVLKIIEEKNIAPKSKWKFLLKNYLFLTVFSLSLFVGALTVSVIIYMLKTNDWDLYSYVSNSLIRFILITLPYLWIMGLVVFVVIAYFNFRHTKKAYCHRIPTIIIGTIGIVSLLGLLFYDVGVGQAVNDNLREYIPAYNKFVEEREKIWHKPEKGMISGEVIFADEENIKMRDHDGKVWIISRENLQDSDEKVLTPGYKIKVMGERINGDNFNPKRARPFPKDVKGIILKKKIQIQKVNQEEMQEMMINQRINNQRAQKAEQAEIINKLKQIQNNAK